MNSQSKKNEVWFNCYLPNGLKCPNLKPTDNNINKVSLHFEPKARIWFATSEYDESIIVIFKALSNQALFVLSTNKNPYSSDKIKYLIDGINEDNINYRYYFGKQIYGHHSGLRSDVKQLIKEKTLDLEFLLSTLGSPAEIKDSLYDGSPSKCYIYLKEGIRIYIVDNQAVGVEEI